MNAKSKKNTIHVLYKNMLTFILKNVSVILKVDVKMLLTELHLLNQTYVPYFGSKMHKETIAIKRNMSPTSLT